MSDETFHPFPRLPTEIRLKIWRLLLPDREIIHVTNADTNGFKPPGPIPFRRRKHLIVPERKAPNIFHVCVESREVCLVEYRRGFESDGGAEDDDLQYAHFLLAMMHRWRGKKGDLPQREVYWRPRVDVILVDQVYPTRKYLTAACVLFEFEAPLRGLHLYGIQHVILRPEYFNQRDWDPRTCGFTWGMETVYIALERRSDDTPEFWEEHLAWFGRWWLKVCKPWRETVGEDAPLEERVPFLPKAIGRFRAVGQFQGEEVLTSKHLDEATECVLAGGPLRLEEAEWIHTSRYKRTWF
ncbi:hypothetical protein BKA64DRAFT_464457 [Cadophora sp. MPI-SDFR-AT-0126]|nr:hypothetical protein BKA64DRAFT_464457 [Leotiomycetes sp. MPI-SDFR-AT-0126]